MAAEPGPLLYLRADRDRLLYTALGVDLPLGEKIDGLATFRSLFRLEDRLDAPRTAEADFETDLRLAAADLVGRAGELKQAKGVLKRAQMGVYWLGGPGGIGKSFLAARLANDYGNREFKDVDDGDPEITITGKCKLIEEHCVVAQADKFGGGKANIDPKEAQADAIECDKDGEHSKHN